MLGARCATRICARGARPRCRGRVLTCSGWHIAETNIFSLALAHRRTHPSTLPASHRSDLTAPPFRSSDNLSTHCRRHHGLPPSIPRFFSEEIYELSLSFGRMLSRWSRSASVIWQLGALQRVVVPEELHLFGRSHSQVPTAAAPASYPDSVLRHPSSKPEVAISGVFAVSFVDAELADSREPTGVGRPSRGSGEKSTRSSLHSCDETLKAGDDTNSIF
ncbi:hypothetical protein KSP39_PZI019176 [Platanthera zijinensis]|uniref:Uncharacterized protein n=1 Tax=Platanthera zijinensis TaxID=2320716 RepID=A0AAP0FYB4_9ASPA